MLLFLLQFAAYAQIGGKDDFYLRVAGSIGGLIAQNYYENKTSFKFIEGLELNYIKPSTGKKLWQYENNFPEHGFGTACFFLNNPKVLGNIYTAYIFCDIPLNKKGKNFCLYLRLAPGFAYAPVHYSLVENPYNDMISAL